MDGAASAAERLWALTGIEAAHFAGPGAPRDGVSQGAAAIMRRCRFLSLADPADARAPGPQFQASDVRAYRGEWRSHLRAYLGHYLAGRQRTLHSPVHHRQLPITAEVVCGPHQAYLAEADGDLVIFLFIGRSPECVYYPRDNLVLGLAARPLVPPDAPLRSFLPLLLSHPEGFARLIERGRSGNLARAFVLGDPRPGHFIKESLAYLDVAEAELRQFIGSGGTVVIIEDWCAMDPVAIFPWLTEGRLLRVPSRQAPARLMDLDLDAHRVFRYRTHEHGAWLRDRAGVQERFAPDGRFRVMISLDAERERVINQVDLFRFVLCRLVQICRPHGLAVEVVWDGWTVSGEASERDREVMARIETLIVAILDGLPSPVGSGTRIFGRAAHEKIAEIARCDLVFVTQGTGALLPSWLLNRPTVVYNIASRIGNRSDLSEDRVFQVHQHAIIEDASAASGSAGSRFAIAPWGMEEAMMRAIGERFPMERTLQWPDGHGGATVDATPHG